MDWGSGNHFLKIEMDASGGTNYAMIGTTQMMSVPYALYAKNSSVNVSISNFGDSLLINGQAIIIPGISYQNIAPIIGSVTDINGNNYSTIDYGVAGEWMAENLKVTNFSNGNIINVAIFNYNGGNLSHPNNQTGQYSNYFDHSYYDYNSSNQQMFYNGYVVTDTRNVCPTGWHVPTRAEWIELFELFGEVDTNEIANYGGGITYLNTYLQSGSDLKDTDYWTNGLTYSTNHSHFSAYPTGMTDAIHGSHYGTNTNTKYWTSTFGPSGAGYGPGVFNVNLTDQSFDVTFENEDSVEFGCIRCKKD